MQAMASSTPAAWAAAFTDRVASVAQRSSTIGADSGGRVATVNVAVAGVEGRSGAVTPATVRPGAGDAHAA
jgi:hypothetical protein